MGRCCPATSLLPRRRRHRFWGRYRSRPLTLPPPRPLFVSQPPVVRQQQFIPLLGAPPPLREVRPAAGPGTMPRPWVSLGRVQVAPARAPTTPPFLAPRPSAACQNNSSRHGCCRRVCAKFYPRRWRAQDRTRGLVRAGTRPHPGVSSGGHKAAAACAPSATPFCSTAAYGSPQPIHPATHCAPAATPLLLNGRRRRARSPAGLSRPLGPAGRPVGREKTHFGGKVQFFCRDSASIAAA